jgi:O-acetylserine/cysteine efflux transporter
MRPLAATPALAGFGRVPAPHLLLALAVVAVWGSNFVVIKWALAVMPPFLLALLRFALALLPALWLVPRPAVPWHQLAAYGVCIGAGQFGLLYAAIDGRIAPGLASLLIQTQVFFTIGLAWWADGERLRRLQVPALLLAVAGVGVIAAHTGGELRASGLGLVLLAALSWAAGNQVARRMGRVPMLGVVVWSSAFAIPPLALLTLALEGPGRIVQALAQADAGTWAAVAWQAVGNTLFGYAAWGWLLARHPAATIAPLALGVPVFGLASAAWLLAEPLPPWKWAAAALVMAGLLLNLLASRRGP